MNRRQIGFNLLCKVAAGIAWHTSVWLAAALFIAPDCYLLAGMFRPASRILGTMFTHFIPSAPGAAEVWLTIDDGPDPEDTPRILELLDRHGARATFFLIGARAQRHPELVDAIVRGGHELAHHSHTHPAATFWMSSAARCRREIAAALPALTRNGCGPTRFRPPVGIRNLSLHTTLAEARLECVGWSIRTGDCFRLNGNNLIGRALRSVRPGAIILMHEGPSVPGPFRVRLIGQLLAGLSQAGYRCVIPPPAALR